MQVKTGSCMKKIESKDLENEHLFLIYSVGYTSAELSRRAGVISTCKQRESNDVLCKFSNSDDIPDIPEGI